MIGDIGIGGPPDLRWIRPYIYIMQDYKTWQKILENAISTISTNLKNIGLDLAPDKTVFIQLTNKNIQPGNTENKIQNHNIKSSFHARFLGIIFDFKMSFTQQVDSIRKRSLNALNIIKYLRGTWWGSDPATLITLYKSYVRSIIEYGSFIYIPRRKSIAYKLETIQNAPIRAALGYRQSTPSNVILPESKLQPIIERARYLCNCYLIKIISNQGTDTCSKIRSHYKSNKKNQQNTRD